MRRAVAAAAVAVFAALCAAPLQVAADAPTPRPVPPSEPWWVPVAWGGHDVTAVRANGDIIDVALGGSQYESRDGGRTWQRHYERHGLVIPPGPRWRIVDGAVVQIDKDGNAHNDPGSPSPAATPLHGGDARGLLAAPVSLDGVVVTVDRDGVVWRRGGDGRWARALLLLPQNMVHGPPRITALTAFDTVPLTDTVYMATDGFSVLASADGGDDWFRAGPGLPNDVNALYADPTEQALYAGTANGLWVHHLRAFPSAPSYSDAALRWRWLGIALVTLAGAAVAIVGLLWATKTSVMLNKKA